MKNWSNTRVLNKKIMIKGIDWKRTIRYDLLYPGETISSDLHCSQLNRLNEAVKKERPELVNKKGVVFHHGSARPHTSGMTRQWMVKNMEVHGAIKEVQTNLTKSYIFCLFLLVFFYTQFSSLQQVTDKC